MTDVTTTEEPMTVYTVGRGAVVLIKAATLLVLKVNNT